MSRTLKVGACLTFVLALLFYFFFQTSKHTPALAQVNAFADDPYDAVGSFGVQFALFAALLSLVRAFRPYSAGKAPDSQKLLLLRAAYFSCLSVAVTLIADAVSMVRHPTVWVGFPAGYVLAALTGGMALFTAFDIWLLHHSTPERDRPSSRNAWLRAAVISVISIVLLFLYPEEWRQDVGGELFTVLFGIAFLFVQVWAAGVALSSYPGTFFEDFIDDLTSVYRWLKAYAGPFRVLCSLFETVLSWSLIHAVLRWLNPRRHTWNLIILMGSAMGALLALAEALGEGGLLRGRFLLIVSIFIGLECAGVLTGYILLAKPMGLFRQTSH